VPLGLTRHRQHLVELRPVTKRLARSTIDQVEAAAEQFKNTLGSFFVYLADEFYLKAGLEIPSSERYEDFPQIENGVGMCRRFVQDIAKEKKSFPKTIKKSHAVIVTGRSAAPFLRQKLLPVLQGVKGFSVEVAEITNRFLGASVTVSGLLVGRDVYNQLKNRHLGNVVLLPPNCLNEDGLFLDDWTPKRLEQKLGVRVYQPFRLREIFKQL
jgi:NifB/MoaA-like Fe-S oxidoreductase